MNIVFVIILVATIAVSYYGFQNTTFFERYKFNVGAVQKCDYIRLVSSGFLHADWQHLILNMVSLFFFQGLLIRSIGSVLFLVVYFGAMIAGSLFSWYLYQRQWYYSAIGASGAVSGIIFAAIALNPTGITVNFLPGWLFGAFYFAYSAFMMFNPSEGDNIGHSAHLGGAVFGLLVAVLYAPEAVINHAFYIGVMVLPLGYIVYQLKNNKKNY